MNKIVAIMLVTAMAVVAGCAKTEVVPTDDVTTPVVDATATVVVPEVAPVDATTTTTAVTPTDATTTTTTEVAPTAAN